MGQAKHQPNILIIMADQLTAKALGCYGNTEVVSPNIDRLVRARNPFRKCLYEQPALHSGAICLHDRSECLALQRV